MGEEKVHLEALQFDNGCPATGAFRLKDCWPTFRVIQAPMYVFEEGMVDL